MYICYRLIYYIHAVGELGWFEQTRKDIDIKKVLWTHQIGDPLKCSLKFEKLFIKLLYCFVITNGTHDH